MNSSSSRKDIEKSAQVRRQMIKKGWEKNKEKRKRSDVYFLFLNHCVLFFSCSVANNIAPRHSLISKMPAGPCPAFMINSQ